MRKPFVVLGALIGWFLVEKPVHGSTFGDGEVSSGAEPVRVRPIPPLPPGPPPIGVIPDEVRAAIEASANLPLPERLRAISEPMLGKPYALDPLGEGVEPDTDPKVRYDAFDCLTFVEEVLALAWAGDPAHASDVRDRLRYGNGPIDYAHRNHFMELQWIPNNVADGWLVDTTAEYGKPILQEHTVTSSMWASWRKRKLFKLRDEELPIGKIRLQVLPLDQAQAAASKFNDGSILLTVRTVRDYSPIWTTHLGFAFQKEVPTFRNASRRSAMRVADERLPWYLEHLKSYGKWPVAGVSVFEPVEQLPRRTIP